MDISDVDEKKRPFVELKGMLPRPTQGKLMHHFGTKRGINGLSWQGVLTASKKGDERHAVSHGRVTFT